MFVSKGLLVMSRCIGANEYNSNFQGKKHTFETIRPHHFYTGGRWNNTLVFQPASTYLNRQYLPYTKQRFIAGGSIGENSNCISFIANRFFTALPAWTKLSIFLIPWTVWPRAALWQVVYDNGRRTTQIDLPGDTLLFSNKQSLTIHGLRHRVCIYN